MATEKLIVQLESDTVKLRADLDKVTTQLSGMENQTNKNDTAFAGLRATSATLASGIATVTASVGALVTSLSAAAVAASDYAREIKIASQLSGLAVEEMQLLASATATVGIGMEQLGDISKDTLEKIGDYLNTGGGGFMDYVDAMKLTESQAIATANEFKTMSGPEVLQEMVKRMEAANVSAVQMSHALEGMASDTTKLIPLLTDGAKGLNALKDASLSVTVPLSAEDIQRFEELKISADNAAASLHSLGNSTLLSLSNWFIKTADTAAHFYGTLNEGSIAQKSSRLADIKEELDTIRQSAEDAESWTGRLYNALTFNTYQESFANEKINALLEERKKLQAEIAESSGLILPTLQESELNKADAEIVKPVSVEKKSDSELQELKDSFKSQEELLAEKYDREMALAAGNKELLLEVENRYITSLMELDEAADAERYEAQMERWREMIAEQSQEKFDTEIAEQQKLLEQKLINEEDYLKEVNKIGQKYGKVETAAAKKKNEDKTEFESDYAMSALQIGEMLFEGNKALEAGLVVAKTGAAVMHQLGSGDPYTAFARAAAAGAIGAVQLAQTLGASKGGGSISTPSATSVTSANDSRFSSSVEINETVSSGVNSTSTSNTLTVTSDNTDTLSAAMAEVLQDMIKRGEIKGLG